MLNVWESVRENNLNSRKFDRSEKIQVKPLNLRKFFDFWKCREGLKYIKQNGAQISTIKKIPGQIR